MIYDLGIIGAGPAGYNAAERASQHGLKTVVFDENYLGGVCLNEGCIPTKTLLYSAKLYDQAKQADKYGLSCQDISFDFAKLMKRKNKIVRKLVGGVKSKLKTHGAEVVMAKAQITGRQEGNIVIESESKQFYCHNLLIATGSQAFIPPIKGLVRDNILTNREILNLKSCPESLVIIGGGVIGMEFGSLFNSLEAKVDIIEMQEEILPGVDPELSAMLRNDYNKRGVNFHLGAKVVELKGRTVVFEQAGQTKEITAQEILVSVGRRPVVEGFGLEKLAVEVERGGIKIDQQCRTNIPNVYAAGDVTGFSLLAHTAYREGEVAVNTIAGIKDQMRYEAIPGVVYTNPEISTVGLTEAEAKEQGVDYEIRQLPMAYAGRFMAENEGKNGITKMIVGKKYGEVLGVHMIGNPSSEIIFGAAAMIEAQLRLKDVQQIVFPHPTVSEILKETAFSFLDKH